MTKNLLVMATLETGQLLRGERPSLMLTTHNVHVQNLGITLLRTQTTQISEIEVALELSTKQNSWKLYIKLREASLFLLLGRCEEITTVILNRI